ncbi:MAG: ParB N-terminal domain-containing protein [Candidatus Diapherotrites archaeon]|nr:ParB N-terminal domain-containing protein [Candidatus Diapherotrites archaeon]
MPLIQPYEERELFNKLLRYYEKIYPDITFEKKEEMLDRKKIGEIYYTFPGEQEIITEDEIVVKIKKALKFGYNTPVIILRKDGKDILIDGHRRLRAAWDLGVPWPALVMVANTDKTFGIEQHIQGKIKELWQ